MEPVIQSSSMAHLLSEQLQQLQVNIIVPPAPNLASDIRAIVSQYPHVRLLDHCFSAYMPAAYNAEVENLAQDLTLLFGGTSHDLIRGTWGQPMEKDNISKINSFTDAQGLRDNLQRAIERTCHWAQHCQQKAVAMEISTGSMMLEITL